jgi:hypothetical protein
MWTRRDESHANVLMRKGKVRGQRIKQFRCFFLGAGGSRAATIACFDDCQPGISIFLNQSHLPHQRHPST